MNRAEARVILGPLAGTWSVLPPARQAELLDALSASQARAVQVLFGASDRGAAASAAATSAAGACGAIAGGDDGGPELAALIGLDRMWEQRSKPQASVAVAARSYPPLQTDKRGGCDSSQPEHVHTWVAVGQPRAPKPGGSAKPEPVRQRRSAVTVRKPQPRARGDSCARGCFIAAVILMMIPPLLGLCAWLN